MLPLVVNEDKLFIFKFWFNEGLQEGTSYKNELYCRLQSFAIKCRPQVYRLGFQLGKQGAPVIISLMPDTCSLWTNLRDPLTESTLSQGTSLVLPPIANSDV